MRNNKSKIKIVVLIALLLVTAIVVVVLLAGSQPISNPYFFEKGITEQEYEGYIYPLSSKEIREDVTLKITRLEEFRDSELYALELEQLDVIDTEDMISMGRQYLGYFYVKDSQIYRLPVKDYAGFTEEQTQSIIKVIREDEKSFLDMCHIVCSEGEIEDAVDDQGYHSGIKADGNQRIYYFYNEDTSGTKDYEKIVWEKGKGIVYYQRGAGNMLMHIEFGVDLEEWLRNKPENQQKQDISVSEEMCPYEVEQKIFSFSIDQGQEYQIPYVRVSGLQDAELQWKINHTLWENACWIFDCAELTTQTIMEQYGGIRKINKDTNVIILARVGKTDRVLSILRNVFDWWIKPEYFEYSTDIFRKWYKREEGVGNMSIIKEHNIILEGNDDIVLVPLTDEHLPLLYQWNSDVEVLYWGEGDDVTEPYDEEMVKLIYGSVSQNAYCFLIQKNEVPVGECWLQKMNIAEISSRYPETIDIRRIDYCLGAKEVWGQGIGTECFRLLQNFAFENQGVDILYVMPYDYNLRSIRMVEHAGFRLEYKKPVANSQKAKFELFYKMTKEDYGNNMV